MKAPTLIAIASSALLFLTTPLAVSAAPVPGASQASQYVVAPGDIRTRLPPIIDLDLEKRQLPVGARLDFKIDMNNFINQITEAAQGAENREGFVRQAMETAFQEGGRLYNVLVDNLSQDYDDQLIGVVAYHSFDYQGIPFGVWIFESGTFTNKGDGGYANWAMRGWVTRDGNTAYFQNPATLSAFSEPVTLTA